jgi:hypothetical protein
VADKPAEARSGKGLKREQLDLATTTETSTHSLNRNGRMVPPVPFHPAGDL